MGKIIDISGETFGKLTVLGFAGIIQKRAAWHVKCSCGNLKIVDGVHLRKGSTISCGCYKPNKKAVGEAAFNDLYRRYRNDAKNKNRTFTLTHTQVKEITSSRCIYCGMEPQAVTKYKEAYNGQYTYNGIDRVDNTKGYTIDNVVPCCALCNKMKGTLTSERFINHVALITLHTSLTKS